MKRKKGARATSPTIRTRLTGVVAVPAIILLAMWAVFSAFTLFNGIYVSGAADGVRGGAIPAVNTLSALQRERQATLAAIGGGSPELATLTARKHATDLSLRDFSTALGALSQEELPEVTAQMRPFSDAIKALPERRLQVERGQADPAAIYDYYSDLIDSGLTVFESMAKALPDPGMVESTLTAIDVTRSADLMSRASSLAAGAIAVGGFTSAQHVEFSTLTGTYRSSLQAFAKQGVEPVKSAAERLTADPAWQRLVAAENALIAAGPREDTGFRRDPRQPPVTAQEWATLSTTGSEELIKLTTQQMTTAVETVSARADQRFTRGLIGSGIALLVAVLGMAIATWIARRLINRAVVNRLDGLKNDSLRLAHERLPDIVDRLRQGSAVDVAAEVPPLDYGTDEIGQVADAFNAAQYTAIAAAVKESQAREGVNRVFLGIAHRHQGLVHRQLKILDKIEREEENPEHLDALFQLDHLATRARRNAENLIILAGEQPGRQWRKPVRLLDILRAAVAETEQYARVRVQQVPDVALQGVAVADTIHLVAELVDNASSFSPPRSQVEVYTSIVSGGVVVEIEDHGLGMAVEDREQANRMLAFPPEFDAMALRGESRLGLFVVARLAVRRSIRVELRESPYGGTVALVFLPGDIVVEGGAAEPGSPSPRARSTTELHRPSVLSSGRPMEHVWADGSHVADDLDVSDLWPQLDEEAVPLPEQGFRGQLSTEDSPPVAPRSSRTNDAAAGQSAGDDGPSAPALPRRRRQQHLAPQLRDEPGDEPRPEHAVRENSADDVRSTMSAFQRGTRDARRADPPVEP